MNDYMEVRTEKQNLATYDKLLGFSEMTNIAEEGNIDKDVLEKLGRSVVEGCAEDKASRADWEEKIETAMKLAKQVSEAKSTPWEKAANVKYPLITNASISFASRAFPEIIKGNRIVQCTVPVTSQINNLILNQEPQNPEEAEQISQLKQENEATVAKMEDISDLISKHMSYQLLVEDDDWENDMERLLQVLPITGMMFKKTYYDENLKTPKSIMCLPDEIIVNDNIVSIERAPRITHIIHLFPHEIIQNIREGLFSEIDDSDYRQLCEVMKNSNGVDCVDETKSVEFYEQHLRFDLDEDGYSEPYIITVAKKINKVVRITPRFSMQDIERNEDNQIVRVNEKQYFTDFHFINSPDGKFHSIGYGILLCPQNETINTLINQLLDAGTLSNRQAGFIGKGIRMDKGEISVNPGEWVKIPSSTGQDIKNNIVPLPVREPSQVLLSLLQLIIKSGNDTANLSELLSGREPTQNSPGVTVLALLEQGMKTDSAIQKRIRRSLKKEFKKLFDLNREYLDDEIVFADGNEFFKVTKNMYMLPNIRVTPVADPNMSSDAQRIARAQALMELKDDPSVNRIEIIRLYLKALQIPDVEKIVPKPEPDAEPPLSDQLIMAQINRENAHANYFNEHAQAAQSRAKAQMIMAAGQTTMNASLSKKMQWDTVISLAQAILEYGIGPEQEAEQIMLDSTLNPQELAADQGKVSSIMNLGVDPGPEMQGGNTAPPQMAPPMPMQGNDVPSMQPQGGM